MALARTNSSNTGILRRTVTTVANNWYRIVYSATTAAIKCGAGTSALDDSLSNTTASAGTTQTAIFKASGTTTHIYVIPTTDLTTPLLDNVSVKEIPATASGWKYFLTADGVDDWMQVTPTLNLGEAWWHVGGWRSDTVGRRYFGPSADAFGPPLAASGAVTMYNEGGSAGNIATGTISNPHTLTIERASASSLSGRINGSGSATIDPNAGSVGAGLALFSALNFIYSAGLAGRFYGGVFCPGALTSGNRAIVEAYVAALAGVTL